jgi:hypothetical protein
MSAKTNERTDKRENWHGLGEMWKMIFPSIRRSFQKRKYVIFLDIGEILEKGVHKSSACDTGIYRFPNFHIFKQFPFQIPYNLDHVGEDEWTDGYKGELTRFRGNGKEVKISGNG